MQQLELELSAVKPMEQLQANEKIEKWKMLRAHYRCTYRYATRKGQRVLRYQIRKLNNLLSRF